MSLHDESKARAQGIISYAASSLGLVLVLALVLAGTCSGGP